MKITDLPRHDDPAYLLVMHRVKDGVIQDIWHIAKETPETAQHSARGLQVTRDLVEVNNRADAEGFLALFHPDARQFRKAEDPHRLADRPSKTVVDHASRQKAYRAMFAQGPLVQVELLDAFAVGDLVVARERVRNAKKPGVLSDTLTILRVRDGLIHDIWDVAQVERRDDAASAASARWESP